jgi:tetratricopeptide (TPR) repeat protein
MRHLFLPLLGLLIFLVEGGRAVVARMANPAARRISGSVLVCVLAIVAVGLGLRTHALGKHWTSQERLLDSFAAVAPLSPEVPYQRGIAAVAQRNLVAAASSLEESIALFPRAPRALLTLGLIRAQQGNQSLAGRALSDAAIVADRVMPKSTVALRVHLSVGTLLATQKLNVPALAEFRKAVLADSTNVEALSRAGLLEVLRYETANDGVRHLTRALALDSTGRVLGPAAERLRVFRDRALNNLEFAEGGGPGYEAAMAEVDSALTQPDGTGYEE